MHIPSEEEEAASQASHSTLIVDIEGDADPEAERIKATRERVMSRSLQIEPRSLRSRAGA